MFEDFKTIFPENILTYQAPMSKYTTFRVGGDADLLVEPENLEQIKTCIAYCREKNYPYFVIGAGSNLLVSDKGYRGVIIRINRRLNHCEIKGNTIYAEAGISLSELASKAADAALTGLEFAEGIPGKLGGGIFMNAGAYGGELNDLIEKVEIINLETGLPETIENIQGKTFGYRQSYFQGFPCAILSAVLKLNPGDPEAIRSRMRELSEKRKKSQPLNYPSAGSTFKRPAVEGMYAGAMIDSCGLKGCTIGGAQISEKHAGFIINIGQATASDIYALIQHVQEVVQQKYGILLETEVRLVGEF